MKNSINKNKDNKNKSKIKHYWYKNKKILCLGNIWNYKYNIKIYNKISNNLIINM